MKRCQIICFLVESKKSVIPLVEITDYQLYQQAQIHSQHGFFLFHAYTSTNNVKIIDFITTSDESCRKFVE